MKMIQLMITGYSATFSRCLHYKVNVSIEHPIHVDCRLSGPKILKTISKQNVYFHSCNSADSSPSEKTTKTVDFRI